MNDQKPTILMVEDEADVLAVNQRMLNRRGYHVMTAANMAAALAVLSEYTPDLLILDIMLPDGSGYDICARFRQKSDQPVLFLTGKKETQDRIEGLQRGGDYYLTKPYNFDELLAVVKRLLEREWAQKEKQANLTTLKRGELVLDITKARAALRGKDISLTQKEFVILLTLIQNEGHEISVNKLYEAAWGAAANNDARVIRTHISNLRMKIDADNSDHYDIVSSYGKGYSFRTF